MPERITKKDVKDFTNFIADSIIRDSDKDGISESYPALVGAQVLKCTDHTVIVQTPKGIYYITIEGFDG